ncbi:FxSxx-COOH system tetratricopeptide repeat protein [Microdochium nivale]|nr:FxSxx-COOH system tetratricopeptide repeat protein [Microdochium nivale]
MSLVNGFSTAGSDPRRPAARRDFEIAIICALAHEADAVEALFDHRWSDDGPPYDKAPGDPNAYSTGALGRHNVVLAYMPGAARSSAAAVAAHCRASFPNIRQALVVGTCGVVPFYEDDAASCEIILGDVLVCSRVVQYDQGRHPPGRFTRKDTLLDSHGWPDTEIRNVLENLQSFQARKTLQAKLIEYLGVIQREPGLQAGYPGIEYDKLYDATYRHVAGKKPCDECGCDGPQVSRARLASTASPRPAPEVHCGPMASGDTVPRSGQDRDNLARQQAVVGFEVEGAGVWDVFPCVVIKAACDYADNHKNKAWQHYAAATAAACAKAFLDSWVPAVPEPSEQSTIRGVPYALALAEPEELDLAPVIVSIPAMRSDNFTGRTEVLDEIKQRLILDDDCRRLAVVGLGGVGKTQVALQFAHWVRDTQPDYCIFWLPASSVEGFDQAYLEMGRQLGVEVDPLVEDPKMTIQRYLSFDETGRWLLVIDNADDTELVLDSEGFLESIPDSETGRVLFTTRSLDVGLSVAETDIVELHEMDPEEARLLMEKSLIRKQAPSDGPSTAELLRELTYLPLAIAQAAAYLNCNRISARRYLELLRATEKKNNNTKNNNAAVQLAVSSGEYHDSTRYRSSHNAVARTWQVSLNQIRAAHGQAAELLAFISCIEPEAIPRSLLPELSSELETAEALGTLLDYSFLSERGDDGEAFDMHSLVHLGAQVWVSAEGRAEEVALEALAQVQAVFPATDWAEDRETWQAYLPHARRVLSTSGRHGGVGSTVRMTLLNVVADCLRHEGRDSEATGYVEEACAWAMDNLPAMDDARLICEARLGVAYSDEGRTAEAIEILQHVAIARDSMLDSGHLDWLDAQYWLARAYSRAGWDQQALELLEHVVSVEDDMLDEADKDKRFTQTQLARAYSRAGRGQEAVELLEYVVDVEDDMPDEADKTRLETQVELARTYLKVHKVPEAIELLEHVIEVEAVVLDEMDPARLSSKHMLALAYLVDEQVDWAIDILEDVVESAGTILDAMDDRRLLAHYTLAKAYLRAPRPQEAIHILEDLAEVCELMREEQGYIRLSTQIMLVQAYLQDGRTEDGTTLADHLLETTRAKFHEDDEERLTFEHNLALAYVDGGLVPEGVALLEHVVLVESRMEDAKTRDKNVSLQRLERARGMLREKEALSLEQGQVGDEW